MSRRRSAAPTVFVAAALMVMLAACGSDAKKATATTTSTTSSTTTSSVTGTTDTPLSTTSTTSTTAGAANPNAGATTTTVDPSTQTLSDEEFAARAKAASDRLDAAGTDLCAVMHATGHLPRAANAAQERIHVAFVVREYTALANALPPADKASADVVRSTLTAVVAEAEAQNYEPSKLGEEPKAIQNKAFTDAVHTIVNETNACPST